MPGVVDELYRRLNGAADELAEELGRPVSIIEALRRLIQSMELEPRDFTWSTRMRGVRNSKGRRTDPHERTPIAPTV